MAGKKELLNNYNRPEISYIICTLDELWAGKRASAPSKSELAAVLCD